MTIEGTSAVQEIHWPTVNMMRPFFTPGLRPIMEGVLTAPQASVTFANVPGNYRALLAHCQARTVTAAEFDVTYWRANADAGNNYALQFGWFRADNTRSSGGTLITNDAYLGIAAGANARANHFIVSTCLWVGYALTDREKISLSHTAWWGDLSALSDLYIDHLAGLWKNQNAITSLTFYSGGNFIADSRFTLYGVL